MEMKVLLVILSLGFKVREDPALFCPALEFCEGILPSNHIKSHHTYF